MFLSTGKTTRESLTWDIICQCCEVKYLRYLGGNQNSHYLDMVFIFNPSLQAFIFLSSAQLWQCHLPTVGLYGSYKEFLLTEWKKTPFRRVTLKVNHSRTCGFPSACYCCLFSLHTLATMCVCLFSHTGVFALLFPLQRRNTKSMKHPVRLLGIEHKLESSFKWTFILDLNPSPKMKTFRGITSLETKSTPDSEVTEVSSRPMKWINLFWCQPSPGHF